MYPRGRKVCFATAGFLLIANYRHLAVSLRYFPRKKRTLGLPIRLQTYCAPGGLAGATVFSRPVGRQERGGRKKGDRQCALAAEEGRTARGAAVFCRPGGPAKPKQGQGPKAPPLLCARCARPPPGGAGKSPGPRSTGPGGAKPWWEGAGLGETPWAKPLPMIYGQRRHHSLAAGCRVKRIAADGARISPCAQGL